MIAGLNISLNKKLAIINFDFQLILWDVLGSNQ
jgi:hypothetical protein